MSRGLVVGVALAIASLAYVLYPLVARRGTASGAQPQRARGVAPVDEARAVADVTDEEIEAAIRSYRASHSGARTCPVCGPRPEPDARYCSSCGRALEGVGGA